MLQGTRASAGGFQRCEQFRSHQDRHGYDTSWAPPGESGPSYVQRASDALVAAEVHRSWKSSNGKFVPSRQQVVYLEFQKIVFVF